MIRTIAAAVTVVMGMTALTQDSRPTFDVASVRRDVQQDTSVPDRLRVSPSGRFDAALSLRNLILYAYHFEGERIEGTQALLREKFMIAAKAPKGVALSHDVARPMVRSLLEDRFRLKVRIESEVRDVLVLRRARPDRLGPNLTRLLMPCIGGMRDLERPVAAPGDQLCSIRTVNERMIGTIKSMADFAVYLSVQRRGPVRDETGLDGSYSVDVTFDPATLAPLHVPNGSPWAAYPTVADAFKESLGLRLDKERAPGRVLVVEHVEPPTEN